MSDSGVRFTTSGGRMEAQVQHPPLLKLRSKGQIFPGQRPPTASPRGEAILLRQPSPRSDFAPGQPSPRSDYAADATGRAAARDSARRARREEAARRLLQRVRLGRSLPPPFCCCRRDASQPAASSIHRAPPLDPILSQHPARGHLPRRRCSRLWRSAAAAARAAPTADGACGFDPRTTLSCGRARK